VSCDARSARPISGRAGWWKSPCPVPGRARAGQPARATQQRLVVARPALLGGPSTSSPYIMKVLRISVGAAVVAILGAVVWWVGPFIDAAAQSAPVPKVGFITEPGCQTRAVALVTITVRAPGCSVRAPPGGSPQDMLCQDVGAYIRRTVNPPRGAIVGILHEGGLSEQAIAALSNGLTSHGFESGGTACWLSKRSDDR
jgi:hypothetical protein